MKTQFTFCILLCNLLLFSTIPTTNAQNCFLAKQFGSTGDDIGFTIKTDKTGNLYAVGCFKGTVDFDPSTIVYNQTSKGSWDAYLVKLDPIGNFIWAKTWGGTYDDGGYGLEVDDSGNVYVVGRYQDTVDFNPGLAIDRHISNAGKANNPYISKFDANGNFKWSRTWGGTTGGEAYSLAVDKSGFLYVAGDYSNPSSSPVDFNPGLGVDNHYCAGMWDSWVSKFDAGGNYIRAKTWGGPLYDDGPSIALDGAGNLYISGMYQSANCDFDPGTGTDLHTASGGIDVFLVKFDTKGNFKWCKTWGGTADDCGEHVIFDKSGYVYVTGYFSNSVDFDPGTATTSYTSAGSYDIFVSKFDTLGNFIWVKQFGSTGDDRGTNTENDRLGNIYCSGTFSGTVDFDPGNSVYNLISVGSNDICVYKLNSSGAFVWAKQMGGSGGDEGYGITVDTLGNVSTTGKFNTTSDFDPSTNTSNLISAGLSDVFISKFYFVTQPLVSFTVNDTSQCFKTNGFVFTNKTNLPSGSYSCQWKFGDGTTSTSTNATHSYLISGSFVVKLILTFANGAKDSIAKNVYVLPNPLSSFTINNNSQCLNGNSFSFINNSTGATKYVWNFGDATASTSTSTAPSYSYAATGNYTVKLVSVSTYGCKDSITKTLDVRPHPISSFSINNNSQCLSDNSFAFTNSTTGASTFLWNFGDATTSVNSTSPFHTYSKADSFIVKLISTNLFGCKDSNTKKLYVRSQPVSSFTINNNSQCLSSNSFVFTNSTMGASTFLWNFGDATTSVNSTSPFHIYAKADSFTVKLISTSLYGCKDSNTKKIYVRPQPVSSFSINNNSQCLNGNSFVFTNLSTGQTANKWNFGDTTYSISVSPTAKTYLFSGAKSVKLIVTSTYGCVDSIAHSVDVWETPGASFYTNDTVQCLNENAFGFGYTGKGAASILLKFGDGTSSYNNGHAYSTVGTFTVKLIATSIKGCTDSSSLDVIVKPSPIVNLGVDTSIYDDDSIILKSGSVFDDYLWSTNEKGIQIRVDSTKYGLGVKTFWLKVTQNGCDGYDTIKITIGKTSNIKDIKANFDLKVYPNPVKDIINFECDMSGQDLLLSISDLRGRLVKTIRLKSDSNKHQLDISQLNSGVYFLNLSNEKYSQSIKIVKF